MSERSEQERKEEEEDCGLMSLDISMTNQACHLPIAGREKAMMQPGEKSVFGQYSG
jgi:hypothetical protein